MWSRGPGRGDARHVRSHLGLESPYDEGWFERPSTQDHRITTQVSISRLTTTSARRRCWPIATQVDPTSRFWFGLPTEVAAAVYPWDDYILAHSLVSVDTPEDDLFSGLR